MITNVLINSIVLLLSGILSIWPAGPALPAAFTTSMTTLAGYVTSYSWLINVSALLACLSLVVGFELTMVGVKGVMWLIRTVRGN